MQNRLCNLRKSFCSMCYPANGFYLLLRVFHNRFGNGCIQVAISSVVNFITLPIKFISPRFDPHKMVILLFVNYIQRFPFDWKTPIGYLIAVALEIQMTIALLRYIECFVVLGFAGLLFAFSAIKDIKSDWNRFDKIARNKTTQCRSKKQLSKTICFHINLRELSHYIDHFSMKNKTWETFASFIRLPAYIVKIYSVTLMALFTGCIVSTCLLLLLIQVELVKVFHWPTFTYFL